MKSCRLIADSGPESKPAIRGLFDGIARRYDFLNSWLSFCLDQRWRRLSRDLVFTGHEESLLDLGTGTGRFIECFLKTKPWKRAVGLDFSMPMLALARRRLPGTVRLIEGDFEQIPFRDGSFDLVVSAFTLRSVRDHTLFFKETLRVLRPSGKVAFLCLTRPQNILCKWMHKMYLTAYLPLAGRWLSGNRSAYDFLSDTVLKFQDPQETRRQMDLAGFRDIKLHSFTMGIVTLIEGRK